MATAPLTTDPADEAGGEEVFSSDGLAPTPITKPPSVPASVREGEDEVVDSDDISPQLAFEMFQGKFYSTNIKSSPPAVIAKETPLARLARLQQEVSEVQAQLSSTTAGSGKDFDEQLVGLVTTLKTQLSDLSSSSRIPEHDDLTRLIRQQLQSLEASKDVDEIASTDTGIVYELYGNAMNPTTTLEDRLLRLERAVGSQFSASGGSNKTLLQRLEEMERLVKTVDETTLEQTTTKAKVIRADLEAASKARNKLTATYKKEDSKMIQQLHTQLIELEGLSDHLPALVERLQQLASLHLQAGTFASRLESLETSANQLSNSVSQIEGSMDQLTSTLATNLTTLEGNLKSLDDRLNKL